MTTGIYIRVSTEEQAKEGYSIANQKEKLIAFCESQGWSSYKIYSDEGYSAKDMKRPALQEMFNDMTQGVIKIILVYKLDRLTRSVRDLYTMLETFDKHDCKFKSATEVYDTTTAMGRLFITLVAALAQWERENTAERVRVVMENNVKNGKWKGGTLAYGYQLKNGNIVINEDEAATVSFIFNKIKFTGPLAIVRELIKKNIPTRTGSDWHVDTIRGIITNPFYIGYQRFNDSLKQYKGSVKQQKLYKSSHESIISEDEFWEVQEILNARKTHGSKKSTSTYYFSTVLTCGVCGASMCGHLSGNKKTYRCNKKKTSGNCDSSLILESTIVNWLLTNLESISKMLINNTITNTKGTITKEKHVNDFQKELKKITKLKEKHKTMYENDIIDIAELIEQTNKYRHREKEIKEIIHNIDKQDEKNEILKATLYNFNDAWAAATEPERKFLINSIFQNISIHAIGVHTRTKPRDIVISSIY
ncbi:hypothetical protein IGM_04375 [Bacillus cereus HuB4-4]|uniref:Recombinase family protein n=1 Tax=Bacillus cereus HuB4-4 TaxID=1053211 RepID=A0A9W5VKD8_BACCE|nr:recombinase family protein [Bacillus cereus]EOP86000.1 hypothetical protein IGM_04375 [Bacillus cereus HuB4-4]